MRADVKLPLLSATDAVGAAHTKRTTVAAAAAAAVAVAAGAGQISCALSLSWRRLLLTHTGARAHIQTHHPRG